MREELAKLVSELDATGEEMLRESQQEFSPRARELIGGAVAFACCAEWLRMILEGCNDG